MVALRLLTEACCSNPTLLLAALLPLSPSIHHAVCFDVKGVGIGLAIYTLIIACFSGFVVSCWGVKGAVCRRVMWTCRLFDSMPWCAVHVVVS